MTAQVSFIWWQPSCFRLAANAKPRHCEPLRSNPSSLSTTRPKMDCFARARNDVSSCGAFAGTTKSIVFDWRQREPGQLRIFHPCISVVSRTSAFTCAAFDGSAPLAPTFSPSTADPIDPAANPPTNLIQQQMIFLGSYLFTKGHTGLRNLNEQITNKVDSNEFAIGCNFFAGHCATIPWDTFGLRAGDL